MAHENNVQFRYLRKYLRKTKTVLYWRYIGILVKRHVVVVGDGGWWVWWWVGGYVGRWVVVSGEWLWLCW